MYRGFSNCGPLTPGGPRRAARGSASKPRYFKMDLLERQPFLLAFSVIRESGRVPLLTTVLDGFPSGTVDL